MAKQFFRSIRFKILLWYIFLLTLTLFSFSIILYGSFSKTLYGDLEDLLSSRAEGIANSINTYHAKKISMPHEGISSEAELNSFLALAHNWVEQQRKDPELMRIFCQILNAKGECLVSSRSMPHIPSLSEEDLKDLSEDEDSFDTVSGELPDGKRMKFRLYTKPVIEEGKLAYIIQVTGPIGLVSLALKNLIFVLFVLLPLTVILAGIPGVLLAGLTLRPVDTMIETLQRITAENLKLKIHLPDTKDEIKRLADTFNDMIERLDRSFSSQQNFIQDITHELKTPLTILKGGLEMTLKRDTSPQEYRSVLRSSLEEIDKLSAVIENLLILARYEESRMALEIKKINLNLLIKLALDNIKIVADEKEIEVSFSCPEKIVLDGDELQLRRMLMNLLDNAIKYTLRKGQVALMAHKDGRHHVKIIISDTGIGMPQDELPYIFDRFYQIDKSRKDKSSFGIGLSIVKSIIDEHKGTVTVDSQEGKGSTFTVMLPLSYPG